MSRRRSIYGSRWVCRCETEGANRETDSSNVVRLLENGARCHNCGVMQMWVDESTLLEAEGWAKAGWLSGVMDGIFEGIFEVKTDGERSNT